MKQDEIVKEIRHICKTLTGDRVSTSRRLTMLADAIEGKEPPAKPKKQPMKPSAATPGHKPKKKAKAEPAPAPEPEPEPAAEPDAAA